MTLVKQPEWQRGGICGALSSTSQQLNIEPSEQRERVQFKEKNKTSYHRVREMKGGNKECTIALDVYCMLC